MQELLIFIENQKQEFAKLPLFAFMQDKSIDPRQRLSFAPCMAHFIMSFSDLNKYVFRSLQPINQIQQVVNKYTFEDDSHWSWFITDLENLELNPTLTLNQALTFIWGEQTKITRQIAYQISGYTLQANPVIKLLVIQALEEMADVFFSRSKEITLELKAINKKEYLYFGNLHLNVENQHSMGTPEAKEFIAEIELKDTERQEALYVIEKIFNIFSEWTYELLAYAQKQNVLAISKDEPTLTCV